ncbi:hypothetical protein V1523DRAFT_449307 [Lipomyces doorenjongii]
MVSGCRMIWFNSLRRRSRFSKSHPPGCVGLFCFDQSSNHQALPPDALAIRKFTLKDKKIKDFIKPGYFEFNGQRYGQEMCYPEGHPKFGWQKGMRTILEERQLWHDKLPRMCQKKAAEIALSQATECCRPRPTLGPQTQQIAHPSLEGDECLSSLTPPSRFTNIHLHNRTIVNYFTQQKRTTQPEPESALKKHNEEERGRSSSDETEVLQPTQLVREETVETETIEIPQGTRGCPLCGHEFHEAAGVRRHVRQVHKRTVQEGPSRYGRPRARQSSPERQLTRQVRRLVAKGVAFGDLVASAREVNESGLSAASKDLTLETGARFLRGLPRQLQWTSANLDGGRLELSWPKSMGYRNRVMAVVRILEHEKKRTRT